MKEEMGRKRKKGALVDEGKEETLKQKRMRSERKADAERDKGEWKRWQ